MPSMTPLDFKLWRTKLGLSQQAAGEALGLHRNSVALYEAGEVVIPKTTHLACLAVEAGLSAPDDPPHPATKLPVSQVAEAFMKLSKTPASYKSLEIDDGILYAVRHNGRRDPLSPNLLDAIWANLSSTVDRSPAS